MKKRIRPNLCDLVIPSGKIAIFQSLPDPDENGCVIWTGRVSAQGYAILFIGGLEYRCNRLALLIAGKLPPDESNLACHTCDNRRCVNPNHLYWGDYRSNIVDCIVRGRYKPTRKLTDEQLSEARELSSLGWSTSKIGRKFGVHATAIQKFLKGKTYSPDSICRNV